MLDIYKKEKDSMCELYLGAEWRFPKEHEEEEKKTTRKLITLDDNLKH